MKQTLKSLLLCGAVAAAMLLASCGKGTQTPSLSHSNTVDSPQTQMPITDKPVDTTSPTEVSDVPEVTSSVSEDQPAEPIIYKSYFKSGEELRYDVKEVLVYDNYNANYTGTEGLLLSNAQINKLLDLLTAAELTEENKTFGEPTGGSRKVCKIVTENETYYISLNGFLSIWPVGEEPFTLKSRDKSQTYVVDSSLSDYIQNLYDMYCNLRSLDTDLPHYDRRLRYDVKEVLLYGQSWGLSYPDDAVRLSKAQINTLLDLLTAVELTEENKGGTENVGDVPIWCVIDTGDKKYYLDFNCDLLIIWASEEEAHTIAGRETREIYSFPDNPLFEYIAELYNEVKPDGVDPIL